MSTFTDYLHCIRNGTHRSKGTVCFVVGVVGLGYVGLPALAVLPSKRASTVLGIDIDEKKTEALANGTITISSNIPV